MKTSEKLQYIESQLPEKFQAYNYREIRKKEIAYYKSREKDLSKLDSEKILNFDFLRAVLIKCEIAEKLSKAKRIEKNVISLETHKYAPELNKLHIETNSGKIIISAYSQTKIKQAIKEFCLNSTLSTLSSLMLNLKK